MTSLSSLLNAVKVPEKDILDAEDKFAGESSEDSLSLAALYIRSKDLDRIKRALNIYQGLVESPFQKECLFYTGYSCYLLGEFLACKM